MPKKKRRERTSQPDEPMTARELEVLRNRRHVHTHELYGAEQVRSLRRPVREGLGYR